MNLIFSLYLCSHFLFYVVWLRDKPFTRSEKGIFLYHFISAVVFGISVISVALIDPIEFGLAGCVVFFSLHGIYSISFLELWSLAQGGYSLSIISEIAQAQKKGTEPDFVALATIGLAKQADRIETLVRLGFVAKSGSELKLTPLGKVITYVMCGLRRWGNPYMANSK